MDEAETQVRVKVRVRVRYNPYPNSNPNPNSTFYVKKSATDLQWVIKMKPVRVRVIIHMLG
jgi:hypothetical protein